MRVKCLAQEHNTMTRRGLEPGPLDPECSTLTTRPPHLPMRIPMPLPFSIKCNPMLTICSFTITIPYLIEPNQTPRGGTQKSFIWGGSTSRSNPLPFYIPFFQKRHPFHIPFIGKRHPFIYLLKNKSLKQEVFLSFISRSA